MNKKGTHLPATQPGINQLTRPLVDDLIQSSAALRLAVSTIGGGTRIIDAGIEAHGGLEAGCRIAEICLGGLGSVRLRASTHFQDWSWHVDVHTSQPVLACLGSQYAGWSLVHGAGKKTFRALGSGPGRALGSSEELFHELGYKDKADTACLVLEVDRIPPEGLAREIAVKCRVPARNLTLILTPTSSLCGSVQIVARVLETALHKAHTLKFPLESIVDGAGSAPLCPPSPNLLTAMSRSNDAILFGGQVQLYVDADDAAAEDLARRLPCSASKDYGKPFGEIFKEAKYDFYKIDPLLFSPARVTVSSLRTGRSFHGGAINLDLLNQSFTREFG